VTSHQPSNQSTPTSNASPLRGIRETNDQPTLGVRFIVRGPGADSPAIPDADITAFLHFLSDFVRNAAQFDTPQDELGTPAVCGTAVQWQRLRFSMYPLYIEKLTIEEGFTPSAPAPAPLESTRPGEWTLRASVLRPDSPDHYTKSPGAWRDWVAAHLQSPDKYSGGFAYNALTIPAADLHSGALDLRPLVLHAIAPDGSACDRGNTAAQQAIANAFWQTFWATGARRAERGATFPVAFLPIDRSSRFEYAAPFEERYVSLRRRLFGRTSILAYVIEQLCRARALCFDSPRSSFRVAAGFDPKAHAVASSDVLLAIQELNRTGWVDGYIGGNREVFPQWESSEAHHQRQPWPYAAGSEKIHAGTKGEDYLETVRLKPDEQAVRIHRVVPYSGCAFLYQAALELDELKAIGKVQDFDGEILAATNSTFFLNFPEEYATLHSTMNDAVALLVENGKTHQVKTLRRAAFFLSEDGDAFITTRAGNRLNSDVLVFEGESSSATYMDKSAKGFCDNQFGPLFFGAVTVGDSLVETFEEMATEVPSNGWIVGDSEAFGGRIDPRAAAEVQVFKPGSCEPMKIRHGFAVGPMLVDDGKLVPLGESREEFQPIRLNENPSFEESSQLARTEIPAALLDCEARGVPPTRFPYDWNVTRAPRTALGVKANGDVLLVVVDGRADLPHSVGATLAELGQLMLNLGCVSAMNMDGGGSSVMFVSDPAAKEARLRPHLREGVVNLPSDMGGVERLLPVPLVLYRRKEPT